MDDIFNHLFTLFLTVTLKDAKEQLNRETAEYQSACSKLDALAERLQELVQNRSSDLCEIHKKDIMSHLLLSEDTLQRAQYLFYARGFLDCFFSITLHLNEECLEF